MKETVINHFIDILKRKDIKDELKIFCAPIINLFFNIITPYIYVIILLFFLIFTMNLAILTILIIILRNKSLITK